MQRSKVGTARIVANKELGVPGEALVWYCCYF